MVGSVLRDGAQKIKTRKGVNKWPKYPLSKINKLLVYSYYLGPSESNGEVHDTRWGPENKDT